MKKRLRSNHNSVYNLSYHLVLTTKYRKKIINENIKLYLIDKINTTLDKWDCKLIEINSDLDHIHILFEAHPSLQISKLVNNLKSVSSRYIRKHFKEDLDKVYYGTESFWNNAYCILSSGGANIETLKQYIQNQ